MLVWAFGLIFHKFFRILRKFNKCKNEGRDFLIPAVPESSTCWKQKETGNMEIRMVGTETQMILEENHILWLLHHHVVESEGPGEWTPHLENFLQPVLTLGQQFTGH